MSAEEFVVGPRVGYGELRRGFASSPKVSKKASRSRYRLMLASLVALCQLVASFGVTAQSSAAPNSSAFRANYDRAEALVRQHRWEQGLEALRPLLQERTVDPLVLNLAGLACTGEGDPVRGNEYFEAALKAQPGFVPALKNLAVNEFNLKEFETAEQRLQRAVTIAPKDPVIQAYLGLLAFERKDYAQASEHLRQGGLRLTADPKLRYPLAVSLLKTNAKDAAVALLDGLPPDALTPRAQFTLAVALAESDSPELAIQYLQAALQANPTVFDIAYDLALCQLQARQFREATATLRKLIAEGHETSRLDNMLAEALAGDHQIQPSVDTLRRAISIDPDDDDNYLDFASLCIDHEAFADAAKVLSVGISVHPQSARLIFERGILNALQDHFAQAEKDFSDAATLAPEDSSGYIGLGVAYLETGKSEEAIRVLRKRTAQQPNDAHLSYLLGEALIRSGAKQGDAAYSEAQVALERSLQLDPHLGAPHSALGSIYLQENRLKEAVDQLEQAKRLDPKDKSAYSHLAIAYRRMGERDKAFAALAQLQQINALEREGARQRPETGVVSDLPNGPIR